MIIRIYNNDGSDYADYEGTLEEIREECKSRIALDSWKNGHSEILEDEQMRKLEIVVKENTSLLQLMNIYRHWRSKDMEVSIIPKIKG